MYKLLIIKTKYCITACSLWQFLILKYSTHIVNNAGRVTFMSHSKHLTVQRSYCHLATPNNRNNHN